MVYKTYKLMRFGLAIDICFDGDGYGLVFRELDDPYAQPTSYPFSSPEAAMAMFLGACLRTEVRECLPWVATC